MVPQQHSSVRRHRSRAEVKFVRQELENLQEIVLEEAVWSRGLPDDIFCTILACLPLSSFCRLRCVCTKWNLIDRDPTFNNAYTRRSSQEACLFFASRDTTWIYEHGVNSWKCITDSFFCPKSLEATWSPVGAVGSKLLLTNNSKSLYDRDCSFKVYNPLSGTQETLPPMLVVDSEYEGRYGLLDAHSEVRIIGMPENSEENYYRILVIDRTFLLEDGDDDDDDDVEFEFSTLHAQVYDSRMYEWDLKEITDPACDFQVLNVVFFGDALQHLLIVDDRPRRKEGHHPTMADLMMSTISHMKGCFDAYDWDGDGKPRLCLPEGDRALKIVTAHIFVIRGRLMLAAAVPLQTTHNRFRKWKYIVIWELMELSGKWVRTTKVDLRELDRRLSQLPLDSFFFLSDVDYLYFGSNTGKFLGIINVPKKTWRLLPPCPGFVPQEGFTPTPCPGFVPQQGFTPTTEARFLTFIYQPDFDLVA